MIRPASAPHPRHPHADRLRQPGRAAVQIEMRLERAHGGQILQCIGQGVSHRYKYKHLKLTTNIVGAVLHPQAGPRAGAAPSTKLTIDINGLMKISHHLKATSAHEVRFLVYWCTLGWRARRREGALPDGRTLGGRTAADGR